MLLILHLPATRTVTSVKKATALVVGCEGIICLLKLGKN